MYITILTGIPTNNIKEVLESYHAPNNTIIISSWSKYKDILSPFETQYKIYYNNLDDIKINKSIEYQLHTINTPLNDIIKDNNHDKIIIRSRLDILVKNNASSLKEANYNLFLNIVKNKLNDFNLISLSHFSQNKSNYYPVDYIIAGYLNSIKKFYNVPFIANHKLSPEYILLQNWNKYFYLDDFVFVKNECKENNIEFIWLSHNNKHIIDHILSNPIYS